MNKGNEAASGSGSESGTWFVYTIRSTRHPYTLYTGITTDPARRLKEHNGSKKGAKATRGGRPWGLFFMEEYPNRSLASRREAEIKKLPRSSKLLLGQSK